MINIRKKEIVIHYGNFINKDNVAHDWSCVEDVVVRNYQGQTIVFLDSDGNDAKHPVLVDFVKQLVVALKLRPDQVVFKTDSRAPKGYPWIFTDSNYRLELNGHSYDRNLTQAKFIGCLAGSRPGVMRARVIYELDKLFPQDAFITCNRDGYIGCLHQFRWPDNQPMYGQEISWIRHRQFDNDIIPAQGCLNAWDAALAWLNIWNQYKIEVVMETVHHHNEFFTDKVAKVLITGKPFVLLCGPQSLQRLREFGFVTFSPWIDESYDNCVLPSQRIAAMMQSLQNLYHSSKRESTVAKMCDRAQQNIEIYKREFGTTFPNKPQYV